MFKNSTLNNLKIIQQFSKLDIKNIFSLSKNLNKRRFFILRNKNFENRILEEFNYFKKFCTLEKLDVDKLSLEKLVDPKKSDTIIENKTEFKKEDNVVEYSSATNWENEVLQCEIPVVVDCYAM